MDIENRRRYERVRPELAFINVRVDPNFRLMDVSVNGLSFYSEVPFENGQNLELGYADDLKIPCEVVDCQMVESDPELLETAYLVRCKIRDAILGEQLVTSSQAAEKN